MKLIRPVNFQGKLNLTAERKPCSPAIFDVVIADY
jgi:hypothetical protein